MLGLSSSIITRDFNSFRGFFWNMLKNIVFASAIKIGLILIFLYWKSSPQIIVQGGTYKRRDLWSGIADPEYKNILKNSAKKGYNILTVSLIRM